MHGNLQRDSTRITRILALDLGKFNSVCCTYDPKSHEHRFVSLQTSPQAVHDLLASSRRKSLRRRCW